MARPAPAGRLRRDRLPGARDLAPEPFPFLEPALVGPHVRVTERLEFLGRVTALRAVWPGTVDDYLSVLRELHLVRLAPDAACLPQTLEEVVRPVLRRLARLRM